MTEQVNPEDVISILRVRLNEEIYQRAMLEAAYTQATQQVKTLSEQLTRKTQELTREQTASPDTTQATPSTEPPETEIPWQQLSQLQEKEN
jgi:hypothetical protein